MDCFNSLPFEITQMVAEAIEDDRDLATFRLICHNANKAIDADKCSFWRRRFLAHFDPPCQMPSKNYEKANKMFRNEYKARKKSLCRGVVITTGHGKEEQKYLQLIAKLIIESFGPEGGSEDGEQTESNNMKHILHVVNAHHLLDGVLRLNWYRGCRHASGSAHPLLLTIQLALTHVSLTAKPESSMARVWGFTDSQRMVYTASVNQPIFKGPNKSEINIEWVLHVANFFKNYLLGKQEPIHHYYFNLDATERPQSWKKRITSPQQKLGKFWKGSYAFVGQRDIHKIRMGKDELIQDCLSGEHDADGFQSLRLEFPEAGDQDWPPLFENILNSRIKTTKYRTATTRAQKRAIGSDATPPGESVSFRFEGEGEDNNEGFLAQGWLNPLRPQHGIPGWQRMTMMKYWLDEDGVIDMSSLWAYEGVVLPGGMIMLGRWWHPLALNREEEYSGPFILWNVDASVCPEDASESE